MAMAMAMATVSLAVAAHHHGGGHLSAGFLSSPRAGGRAGRSCVTISMRAQKKKSRGESGSGSGGGGGGGDGRASSERRVWRRRKLTKVDDMLRYKLDRIPFLEEKVRKVRENGKIVCLDINQLMLSQENRFAFTMEVAEEANTYLEKNRHEYGLKKPILHVLSDRMNEAGFSRPEGYLYPYPIKPGPYFIKEEGH
ncbi:protein PLASTID TRANSCRIPTIONALLY ACTIVE 7-like [Phragmites australis]|uniref:protein PLASTID TRANSCRIPTIONALLY ACTIVE 7-like n=1 Tax=Phragmites australis TaxID=29695 RepID=UPI002D77961F|nr:protein PLASTID TRANSCRIPTIONALLY ACTIVE 7-like [Phragmites australis]